MDKRKAAFTLTAVGAVVAGLFSPLASMAECYIYKFTTQPVIVETQPVTVRRFVERVQPVVSFETPVQIERTVSKPAIIDTCMEAPVSINQCADQPAVMETRSVSAPVMISREISGPVMVDACPSATVLIDKPLRRARLIKRTVSKPVMMSSSRAEVIQTLRTLGLPIVVDRNDLDDWDTIKIKRKKILGVRQPVLELKD